MIRRLLLFCVFLRDLTVVGWTCDTRGYLAHSESLSSKLAKFKV
jgi:hypothetical protein